MICLSKHLLVIEVMEVEKGVLQICSLSESMVDCFVDEVMHSLLNLCHHLTVDEMRHMSRNGAIYMTE